MTAGIRIFFGGHRVPFTDKSLTCADCGSPFTFTAGEQEFHQSKGFTNEPRRCPTCRAARRTDGGGGGGGFSRGDREMFSATCGSCGKEAKVPFQPRGDKPVYCSDCFRSQPRSSDRPAGPRYFSPGVGGGYNARLDSGSSRDGRSDRGPGRGSWAMQPFSSTRSPRRREIGSGRSN